MNASRWVLAAAAVGGVAAVIVFGPGRAHADPLMPGCLDSSQYAWYNPCSGQAPWNQPNWAGRDGIPGTYGPHGYTPSDDAQPSS
jgi:hypothetical protein